MKKGKFIVLEGLDGSGKGTQISLLADYLRREGHSVYLTAEPTTSSVGGIIRDTLGGFAEHSEWELSALFLADRIFHNTNPVNGIQKFINEGTYVLCDRYYYSSFAYQGIDADLDWVMQLNLGCSQILRPDLCIFLDLDVDSCNRRISQNRFSREIYENTDSLRRIRSRFLEVFDKLGENENIAVVDASGTVSEVSAEIIKIYSSLKEK